MTDHPITPPPELLSRWEEDWHHGKVKHTELEDHIATQAARWGADQELEACCEWVVNTRAYDMSPGALRTARRPKPPSLKEQALAALGRLNSGALCANPGADTGTIRRALEALPE